MLAHDMTCKLCIGSAEALCHLERVFRWPSSPCPSIPPPRSLAPVAHACSSAFVFLLQSALQSRHAPSFHRLGMSSADQTLVHPVRGCDEMDAQVHVAQTCQAAKEPRQLLVHGPQFSEVAVLHPLGSTRSTTRRGEMASRAKPENRRLLRVLRTVDFSGACSTSLSQWCRGRLSFSKVVPT